ncbi:helix-turn-helix domain-containing protein [Paenibacillus sp. GCM10027628]|uniref:helix-turn-helix domain-containing protein n=1 Tax=Paenibacillus sp. GCM10027628 TaxID=3273413 RepID=UPI003626DB43
MDHNLYKQANTLLNQRAIELHGEEVSFLVHYWGMMPEHFDNPVHRHSFFEVCYVMQGEGSYTEYGITYPLSAGTIFCSRPGVWHQIQSTTGLALFFVAFEVNESESSTACIHQFKELAEKAKAVISHAEASPSIHIWNAILGLIEKGTPATEEMYLHLCHSLLQSFLYLFSEQTVTSDDPRLRDTNANRLIHRAKLYIDDNLSSALTLQHITQYLHISERHLSRLFLSHLGQSFIHYIQEKRVQKSIELLLNSELAVKEIAKAAGFESVHYFTRVFTNKIGVPPAMFRKSQFSDNLIPR